jgi:hypothetical protein
MPRATSPRRKDATLESRQTLSPEIRRKAKPAEKQVRETARTVPLAPPRRGRRADAPIPVVAADQRRQVVGTDEPKGQSRRSSTRTSKSNPLGLRTGMRNR